MQFFAAFGSAFYAFVAAAALGVRTDGYRPQRRSSTIFNSLDVRGMTGPVI
jgi:hypothetical protein